MADPSHSATTASSGPGSANSQIDKRILGPFLSTVRKPLSTSVHEDLRYEAGLLRKSFPGNPVLIGHIPVHGRWRVYVTGDTDDQDNVTLSVQSKNIRGVARPDNELLAEGLGYLQGLTQPDIRIFLQVDPAMWAECMKPNTDVECLELVDERFGNNPSWVRDSLPKLFRIAITNYVVQTIKAAREKERREFLALARANRPKEIYSRCGWLDLAQIDEARWLEELRKSARGITGM